MILSVADDEHRVHDWWINFINNIDDAHYRKYRVHLDVDGWKKAKIEALAQFGGELVWEDSNTLIKFENDRDATLFLLRWYD